MERILYDGLEYLHPASFPEMVERTITVGSVSKEYRMIGWRVGWIVTPSTVINDIAMVTISNGVCPVGISQKAATIALRRDSEIVLLTQEWQRRRDIMLDELDGLGLTGTEFSGRLLKKGQVAATAMTGWGSKRNDRFVRFVFSNEPAGRLKGLRARIEAAIE